MRPGLLVAALAVASLPSAALAHHNAHPLHLHVGLTCRGLELVVAYALQPGAESRDLRSLFDADRDGALSEGEQVRLLAALRELSTFGLRVSVAGSPASLPEARVLESIGADKPAQSGEDLGIRVQVDVPVVWTEQAQPVRFRDRHKDPRYDVSVTVGVDPGLAVGAAVSDLSALRSRPMILRPAGELAFYVSRGACASEAGGQRLEGP